jgi:hypothetical protein
LAWRSEVVHLLGSRIVSSGTACIDSKVREGVLLEDWTRHWLPGLSVWLALVISLKARTFVMQLFKAAL